MVSKYPNKNLVVLGEYLSRISEEKFADECIRKRKAFLPKPEFYVIYTGKTKNCTKEISMAEEFFGGSRKRKYNPTVHRILLRLRQIDEKARLYVKGCFRNDNADAF